MVTVLLVPSERSSTDIPAETVPTQMRPAWSSARQLTWSLIRVKFVEVLEKCSGVPFGSEILKIPCPSVPHQILPCRS